MPALASEFRKQLESVIIQARDLTEAAACSALQRRAVDAAEPFAHFTAEDRTLRNRLRARGRQAGDVRRANGEQSIDQLTQELAYEYWHRMLFARFLAENHLLMHPDGVAVNLAECEELAASEGAPNGYVLAARYARTMLPQIFRTDDVLLDIEFPVNDRLPLERLLASLPSETFIADDSLGWVYQFWQTQKKKEVNTSGVKIDGRTLPTVTQLFTEHYMVQFLLDNTLGAWWAGKVLTHVSVEALRNADEASIRKASALPDVTWDYLRFIKDHTDNWCPAAGVFDQWPRQAKDLRILDPCMGSGHFLVAELSILVAMRMREEELSQEEAVKRVLQDNLFGLELDLRCTQIAAFNLALAAWKLIGRPVELPPLNLACSGLAPGTSREEWLQILETADNELRFFLGQLYDLFAQASELGSLINPSRLIRYSLHSNQLPALLEALNVAMEREDIASQRFYTPEVYERGVTAQGMAQAARLLTGHYHLVATNVPYLVRNKQGEGLRHFVASQYPNAIADMAMAFLERCREFCEHGGTYATVTPQNWLFLTSYHKLRLKLLQGQTWNHVTKLGSGATAKESWEVLRTLSIISNNEPTGANLISGLEAGFPTEAEKALWIRQGDLLCSYQDTQLRNPDARVSLDDFSSDSWLSDIADYGKGSTTGDSPRFLLCFWEFPRIEEKHVPWLNLPTGGALWSGRSQVCTEPVDSEELKAQLGCWLRGNSVWRRRGVVVNKMRELKPFLYSGEVFDDNVCPICPKDEAIIPAIWAYVKSGEYHENVRRIDQKLNVTAATLTKVPFNLAHWTSVAQEKYPNGLPKPYSDDPTQWIFHGHPARSDAPLQVAVARLLGYRWPAEQDSTMELSDDARAWVKKSEGLLAHADRDGIVCLPAVRGEPPAAERLLEVLHTAYGTSWSTAVLNKLLTEVGCKPGTTLDDWLRHSFFEQHYKLFHHRPFIWHIWDGRRDGFACLVNYHQLDDKLLENLTYSYLQDWINTQTAAARESKTGADLRLKAAQDLQDKLKLILTGAPPYDIFVRWKPIEAQPIGWHPDLNDGVRLNIRPFMTAGVLRKNPNIIWTKDRGKDPASAPWFPVFKGERINDHHLTIAEKQAARAQRVEQ
jgi:Eco57I restriction-modification methylase